MTGDRGRFPPDRETLVRCPVCDAPTVSRLARLRLYLGSKERCAECMAGWRFVWGRWLYHLPIFATFLAVLGAYLLLDATVDGFVVLGAVLLAATIVPLVLPIEARVGDRLTDHALRRRERAASESEPPSGPESDSGSNEADHPAARTGRAAGAPTRDAEG